MKNKLFETFRGEYVSIMTKMTVERTTSNGEIIETIKTPISIQGFLIDTDDDFYYLGYTLERINQAIPDDEVGHIEIVKEEANLMDQLLIDGEIPPENKFN